jgi:hypothetical protein
MVNRPIATDAKPLQSESPTNGSIHEKEAELDKAGSDYASATVQPTQ